MFLGIIREHNKLIDRNDSIVLEYIKINKIITNYM